MTPFDLSTGAAPVWLRLTAAKANAFDLVHCFSCITGGSQRFSIAWTLLLSVHCFSYLFSAGNYHKRSTSEEGVREETRR